MTWLPLIMVCIDGAAEAPQADCRARVTLLGFTNTAAAASAHAGMLTGFEYRQVNAGLGDGAAAGDEPGVDGCALGRPHGMHQ